MSDCKNLDGLCDYEIQNINMLLGREPTPEEEMYWLDLYGKRWEKLYCANKCGYADLCGITYVPCEVMDEMNLFRGRGEL